MKKTILFLFTGTTVLFSCQNKIMEKTPYAWPTGINAPVAIEKTRTFIQHDDTIQDEYYWMNDYFKKGPDSTAVEIGRAHV